MPRGSQTTHKDHNSLNLWPACDQNLKPQQNNNEEVRGYDCGEKLFLYLFIRT